MHLRLRDQLLDLSERTLVMAIVNRTPDSFYDQGRTYNLDVAIDHALAQVEAGADIIDIGGVKAGPGPDVDAETELSRVLPAVIQLRRRSDVFISVDTFRASVAEACLEAGADIINDTSGMTDASIADAVAARPGTALVVMHAGPVRTRPFRTTYTPDVVTVVTNELRRLTEQAQERGVPADALITDPGHDFAKNTFHSLELTRRLDALTALGYPVLVALSNKDFLGETLGGLSVQERNEASLAAAVASVMLGARIIRVHDTQGTVRAVRTVEAILGWRTPAMAARGLD